MRKWRLRKNKISYLCVITWQVWARDPSQSLGISCLLLCNKLSPNLATSDSGYLPVCRSRLAGSSGSFMRVKARGRLRAQLSKGFTRAEDPLPGRSTRLCGPFAGALSLSTRPSSQGCSPRQPLPIQSRGPQRKQSVLWPSLPDHT